MRIFGRGGGKEGGGVTPAGAENFIAQKPLGIRPGAGQEEADPLARWAGTIDFYKKGPRLDEALRGELEPLFTIGGKVDVENLDAVAKKISQGWDKRDSGRTV